MNLVTNDSMNPEEVNRMKLVFEAARKNINQNFDELKNLAFKFDQFMIANNFDEAEVIMGKIATLSVAVTSWNFIKDNLGDYEDPYEALVEGVQKAYDYHTGGQKG